MSGLSFLMHPEIKLLALNYTIPSTFFGLSNGLYYNFLNFYGSNPIEQ